MKKENMLAAMMFGGQAGGGGGGADAFVVKVEEKLAYDGQSYTYTFDHTAEETRAAAADGKRIQLIIVNENGDYIGYAECDSSISTPTLFRAGRQTIASIDPPRKATNFNYGELSWNCYDTENFLIPSVASDQHAFCPMIYNGQGSGIVAGTWHYYLDLSSMFESYVLNIEAAASISPDGQAYLTATIPDGVSPYEDLSWLISKVYSEFMGGLYAHTSWFRLTTSSEINAPVTMIRKNQFTMTFTDVQPLSGGTADIFDVTINLCASTSPDVVSVTFGAKHYTSTAYTPS